MVFKVKRREEEQSKIRYYKGSKIRWVSRKIYVSNYFKDLIELQTFYSSCGTIEKKRSFNFTLILRLSIIKKQFLQLLTQKERK